MQRTCTRFLLLGVLLAFTHCAQPSPTSPTPSTPDPGQHLLVEVSGDLSYKHPGWKDYLPLSFGIALSRGDLLQAGSDAEGLIVCADLSLAPVPSDFHGGLPCPQATSVLTRGESLVMAPQMAAAPASSIPYVLSPRHTFVQTGHPLLRWRPSDTGIVKYTVRVWGGDLDWRMETTATEIRYPEGAPPLEPGVPYYLTVADADGRSSDEEGTALDMSFSLLPTEELAIIQSLVAQVQELGLDERATRLLEAEVYAAHGLRADGTALLEALVAGEDAPAVHGRLGDMYLGMELYAEAREAYERTLVGYHALGDRAGEAAALAGLGLAHWGNRDDRTAREHLGQARELYAALGDADGVTQVEEMLIKMGGDE